MERTERVIEDWSLLPWRRCGFTPLQLVPKWIVPAVILILGWIGNGSAGLFGAVLALLLPFVLSGGWRRHRAVDYWHCTIACISLCAFVVRQVGPDGTLEVRVAVSVLVLLALFLDAIPRSNDSVALLSSAGLAYISAVFVFLIAYDFASLTRSMGNTLDNVFLLLYFNTRELRRWFEGEAAQTGEGVWTLLTISTIGISYRSVELMRSDSDSQRLAGLLMSPLMVVVVLQLVLFRQSSIENDRTSFRSNDTAHLMYTIDIQPVVNSVDMDDWRPDQRDVLAATCRCVSGPWDANIRTCVSTLGSFVGRWRVMQAMTLATSSFAFLALVFNLALEDFPQITLPSNILDCKEAVVLASITSGALAILSLSSLLSDAGYKLTLFRDTNFRFTTILMIMLLGLNILLCLRMNISVSVPNEAGWIRREGWRCTNGIWLAGQFQVYCVQREWSFPRPLAHQALLTSTGASLLVSMMLTFTRHSNIEKKLSLGHRVRYPFCTMMANLVLWVGSKGGLCALTLGAIRGPEAFVAKGYFQGIAEWVVFSFAIFEVLCNELGRMFEDPRDCSTAASADGARCVVDVVALASLYVTWYFISRFPVVEASFEMRVAWLGSMLVFGAAVVLAWSLGKDHNDVATPVKVLAAAPATHNSPPP